MSYGRAPDPVKTARFPIAWIAAIAVLLLQACLLGGGPKSSSLDEDMDAAEALIESGRCSEAVSAFDAVIQADSTRSRAYYGQFRATACKYGLGTYSILADLRADTAGLFFFSPNVLSHPDSVLNKRQRASKKVLEVYRIATDRDTLTRYWKYLDNVVTPEESDDPWYAEHRARMQAYLMNADMGMPGYRPRGKFPLMDTTLSMWGDFEEVYAAVYFSSSFHLADMDRNDTLDARDRQFLLPFPGGGFSIDSLSSLAGELETDTALVGNLNAILLNASNDLLNISQLFADLVPPSDSISGGSGNVDSVKATLGSTLNFFLLGDKVDNDGDGCLDEEILDGKDNDLDGFVDEDSRVIPDTKPDGVDNDLDGRKDPISPPSPYLPGNDTLGNEALVGATVNVTRPHLLGFVHRYLVSNGESALPYESTTWVKIKKDSPDMSKRFAVQADSLLTKRLPSGRLPDSLSAKLQSARTLMGGCWRNLKTVSE